MRITHLDLQKGDTVSIREHTAGGFCLMVERDGLMHTVLYENGHVILFGTKEEIEDYCRKRGLVPKGESRPALGEGRGFLPAPEDNLPLPPIPPEWEEVIDQALIEVIGKKASYDLWILELLVDRWECFQAELERRKKRGRKSCTCSRCLHWLESEMEEAKAAATELLYWWLDAVGASPREVVDGKWTPEIHRKTPC